MNIRFLLAMGAYVALGVLAAFTTAGPFRMATLVFLAGLAVKTWLVMLRRKEDQAENARGPAESTVTGPRP